MILNTSSIPRKCVKAVESFILFDLDNSIFIPSLKLRQNLSQVGNAQRILDEILGHDAGDELYFWLSPFISIKISEGNESLSHFNEYPYSIQGHGI